jgi:Aerotolerance regulator N-terminal/von Willebrand factor type A domain
MLSFLSPLFLVGTAAAAIPIVLHLLKREPEARVRFAAVKLLKRAPVEHTQRRHLRELILLALRVAALTLLALAFARPFFASGAAVASSGVTVVALDTSYSMSAPGRFERARQLAKDAIARAPAGDLVGVVTFSDAAQIAAKPSADRVLATSAIDEATPGFGATRYRGALSAASQALGGRNGAIVVVTDLQETGWDAGDRASVPEGARIDLADVGAPPADLAVIAVQPQADRVGATVRNTGSRGRDARVHLTIDNRAAGDVTVNIGPNQVADVAFAGAPRGSVASVAVDDGEGIQADNVRYAVLGGTQEPSVLIVSGSGDLTREGFYVRHALAAGAGPGGGYQAASVAGSQLSSSSPGAPGNDDRFAPYAAVFVLSTRGLERKGREVLAAYARNGGGVLVAAGPDVDGDVIADVLGSASTLKVVTATGAKPEPRALAPADVRHPVFHPFASNTATLGLVTFQQVSRIGGSACQTLGRFTTGETALVECAAGDGRALVFASDLENRWNDFPVHATFVPFIHEVVRYLASARAHAGEYLVADAPAGAPQKPGVVQLTDLSRPGGAPRTIAINVDPREADPARLSMDDFQSAVTRLKDVNVSEARVEARQQEDRQHLWQYALALMALLLVAEGLLAARTA